MTSTFLSKWKNQIRFESEVIENPHLEDLLKSFASKIVTDYEEEVERLNLTIEELDKTPPPTPIAHSIIEPK
jgi:hypothetical protein